MSAAFDGPHGYDLDEANRPIGQAMETPDEEKQAALFAAFKKNRTWQVPTLVVQRPLPPVKAAPDPRLKYMHPALTQLWGRIQTNDKYAKVRESRSAYARATVRAMHKAGVPLLAGTDAGGSICVNVFPGFALADELELLVECGLTPADALRTATLNPALYLGEEKTSGTVAVGKQANLVLLDADPLSSIANVRKISGVLVDGKWLPRAELDEMLKSLVESNAKVKIPK